MGTSHCGELAEIVAYDRALADSDIEALEESAPAPLAPSEDETGSAGTSGAACYPRAAACLASIAAPTRPASSPSFAMPVSTAEFFNCVRLVTNVLFIMFIHI